jgi:hypothetical protein
MYWKLFRAFLSSDDDDEYYVINLISKEGYLGIIRLFAAIAV